jgi:hypothetical protein
MAGIDAMDEALSGSDDMREAQPANVTASVRQRLLNLSGDREHVA